MHQNSVQRVSTFVYRFDCLKASLRWQPSHIHIFFFAARIETRCIVSRCTDFSHYILALVFFLAPPTPISSLLFLHSFKAQCTHTHKHTRIRYMYRIGWRQETERNKTGIAVSGREKRRGRANWLRNFGFAFLKSHGSSDPTSEESYLQESNETSLAPCLLFRSRFEVSIVSLLSEAGELACNARKSYPRPQKLTVEGI